MSDQNMGLGAADEARDLAGIDQEIQRLHRQSEELEEKLQDQKNYLDSEGKFEGWRYEQDKLRVQRNLRKITELRDQRGKAEKQSDSWQQHAQQKAANYLKGNLSKVDEDIRDQVKKLFTEQWQRMVQGGTFMRPEYQNEDTIQQFIEDRFSVALGEAVRKRMAKNDDDRDDDDDDDGRAPPREAGLDEKNRAAQEPPPEDDGFGEDEDARKWSMAYRERIKQPKKTLYEQQRERLARQLGEDKPGGEQ